MKRTALKWGTALVACAGVFYLGACGDTVYDGRQDTVLTLDAPRVTAKAYPGVNIVSWEPVTGAQGYNVYVYENGVSKGKLSQVGSAYLCLDTDLVNNTEYTYHVEAQSDSNPGTTEVKAVYAQNSRGKASVRAIVPPAGTKALELAAYEGGYDGKTAKTLDATKDEYVLTADRIKLDVDAPNGYIYVDFPMKAYLTYDVKAYTTGGIDHAVVSTFGGETTGDDTSNNVTGHYAFTIGEAGIYQVAITATSRNRAYPSSEEIVAGKVEVKELKGIKGSVDVNAAYLYASLNDKTVRVTFKQLKKADGSVVPTSWYKVYRRVAGEYDTTPVTADIHTDSGTNTYYLDDTVSSIDVGYDYIVVITNGEAYAKASDNTCSVNKKKNISSFSVVDAGAYSSTDTSVTWGLRLYDSSLTLSNIKAYALAVDDDRDLSNATLTLFADEIERTGTPVTFKANTEEYSFYTYVSAAATTFATNKTPYLLVVITESGKDPARKIFSQNGV